MSLLGLLGGSSFLPYAVVDVSLAHARVAVGDGGKGEAFGEEVGDDEAGQKRVHTVGNGAHEPDGVVFRECAVAQEMREERLDFLAPDRPTVGSGEERGAERRRPFEGAADAAGGKSLKPCETSSGVEDARGVGAHLSKLGARRQELFREFRMQVERADRKARLAHDLPRFVVNHLRACAADVEEQACFGGEVVRCADEVKLRLLLAADHIDVKPCALLDRRDRLAAVRGVSECARRKDRDVFDAKCSEEFLKVFKRVDETFDAAFFEHVVMHEGGQSDGRVLLFHDLLHGAVLDLVDRHAHGVGADVDDCVYHWEVLHLLKEEVDELFADEHRRHGDEERPYIGRSFLEGEARAAPSADDHGDAHGEGVGEIDEPEAGEKHDGGEVAGEVQCARVRRRTEEVEAHEQEGEEHEGACARSEEAVVKAEGEGDDSGEEEDAPTHAAVLVLPSPVAAEDAVEEHEHEHDDDEGAQEVGRHLTHDEHADGGAEERDGEEQADELHVDLAASDEGDKARAGAHDGGRLVRAEHLEKRQPRHHQRRDRDQPAAADDGVDERRKESHDADEEQHFQTHNSCLPKGGRSLLPQQESRTLFI